MRIATFTLSFLTFILLSFNTFGQKFAIHFTDKENTPYNLNNPQEFLSERALERREKYDIAITEEDFPVNPNYLASLEEIGCEIIASSRWLNCAVVSLDSSLIESVNQLPFVEKVVYVSPENQMPSKKTEENLHHLCKPNQPYFTPKSARLLSESLDYGYAEPQIAQLNGIELHDLGYKGAGILIAVLDAGFNSVDDIDALAHLFDDERIVMTQDLVSPGNNIYHPSIHTHGTSVLSCMAANVPGHYVGTAPEASYCLIRTEDYESEYLIEAYNWTIGAEVADSIGADIINSSLGYNEFDDPSMNTPYEEMDGYTLPCSYGASRAVAKGLHLCISSGNSNGTQFPWVSCPGNNPEATTIGAVTEEGEYVYFSSIGPNGAGVQKPELMAMGYLTAAYLEDGQVYLLNGTSISSPILCGLTACLIQAYPNETPQTIKARLIASASQANNPDNEMGYGIPDFMAAYQSFVGIEEHELNPQISIFPNPATTNLNITSKKEMSSISIYDLFGRLLHTESASNNNPNISVAHLSQGVYILRVEFMDGGVENVRWVK